MAWKGRWECECDRARGGMRCECGRISVADWVFMRGEHERHFEVVDGMMRDSGWIDSSRRSSRLG